MVAGTCPRVNVGGEAVEVEEEEGGIVGTGIWEAEMAVEGVTGTWVEGTEEEEEDVGEDIKEDVECACVT